MPQQQQIVFDPPAFLPDFDARQRQAWDELVRSFFTGALQRLTQDVLDAQGDPARLIPQFFDPTSSTDEVIVQPITWNAFPKELLVRFGRRRALIEADRMWPLSAYPKRFYDSYYIPETPGTFVSGAGVQTDTFYRPQVEYCEWHVTRDVRTGKITRVSFTSEPPEYWIAMFGGPFPSGGPTFPDGRHQVLQLYREMVSPEVKLEDLIAPMDMPDYLVAKGGYNPYNKWNTTHGIMHLCAPPNSLGAEVTLGAEATLRRKDRLGAPVANPEALVCCAGYGGANRNSDPTIGAAVNALARLGAMVTLPNPVGLYMDHIDLAGWETPDGSSAERYVKILRGSPSMIERLVVEVPAERGFTVSDIRIAGAPIDYGGQIAECITVKLNGAAKDLGKVAANELLSCVVRCCVDPQNGSELATIGIRQALPPGTVAALGGLAGAAPERAVRAVMAAGLGRPHPHRALRRRVPILDGEP